MTPPLTASPAPTPEPAAEFEVDAILASVRAKARLLRELEQLPHCPIAPRELPPGTRVGPYRLLEVLGTGGFAVTYLAQEEGRGQRVVVKEHVPEYLCYREAGSLRVLVADEAMEAACEAARASFLREHSLLSTLEHPCIPRATACFESHNTVCYASEYIEGVSLGELAEECRSHHHHLPQEEVYAALVRLLDALDYLHGKELLHRDIKPENILITREGLPMLIDFGAAHELHSGEPACVVETPGFSPAEQGHTRGKLGPWTDIYALGATFYYLLTGETLPPGRRRELVDHAIPLTQRPALRAHYHPRLLASLDRATRPRARERYQSVSQWLTQLRGKN